MNKSQTLCVDASIVIRLVMFPGDPILEIWNSWADQGSRLIAPTLLYYEVVNGIYQYRKHNQIDDTLMDNALTTVLTLPINIIGATEIHLRAAQLAAQIGLPATYDAHYLALAERMAVDLWTADKRLVKTCQEHGLKWVNLIE